MNEPIKVKGYGKWIESLCTNYSLETILFRNTSERYTNALLNCTTTRSVLIGIFDYHEDIGKIFDRRKVARNDN